MRRNKTLIAAVLSLALVASAVGGVATYTTFTADRQATISVVSDDSGVVSLNPVGSSAFVYTANGGG